MDDTRTLTEGLEAALRAGDEAAARAFVLEHFTEFPDEVQQALALDIVSEALDGYLAGSRALELMKQDAADMIRATEEPAA